MVRKVRDINEINKNMKKAKYYEKVSSKLGRLYIENNWRVCDGSILDSKLLTPEQKYKDLLLVRMKSTLKENNLLKNTAGCTRQREILYEKYLQLYIRDIEIVKNVHVTLYVTNKTLYDAEDPDIPRNEEGSNYHHMLMLCKHAILCLIEPSEKAFVHMEDNLSVIIQNHLSRGCVYHFDLASTKDYYSAVLILSEWAKPLVGHPNTTMLRTISIILKCSIYDILVLSPYSDNDFL